MYAYDTPTYTQSMQQQFYMQPSYDQPFMYSVPPRNPWMSSMQQHMAYDTRPQTNHLMGVLVKIAVIIIIPYAYYKFFTSFPLMIPNLLINAITLNWDAVKEQIKDMTDPSAYLESLQWLSLVIVVALVFLGFCLTKDIRNRRNMLGKVLKKLFPKLVAYVIPLAGQLMLLFDVLACFVT